MVCGSTKGVEGYIQSIIVNSEPPSDETPRFVDICPDYEGAPPPLPQLPALCATCARVVHMSGAARFFGRSEWEAEEYEVLALHGSSARLLSNLMSPYAVDHGAG